MGRGRTEEALAKNVSEAVSHPLKGFHEKIYRDLHTANACSPKFGYPYSVPV